MVDKLRLQFYLGSPIAVRLKRQRKRWILFWVEGDDPNESTIKGAVSYISTQIPSPEASRQSHSLEASLSHLCNLTLL